MDLEMITTLPVGLGIVAVPIIGGNLLIWLKGGLKSSILGYSLLLAATAFIFFAASYRVDTLALAGTPDFLLRWIVPTLFGFLLITGSLAGMGRRKRC